MAKFPEPIDQTLDTSSPPVSSGQWVRILATAYLVTRARLKYGAGRVIPDAGPFEVSEPRG